MARTARKWWAVLTFTMSISSACGYEGDGASVPASEPVLATAVQAATVPAGFVDELVVSGLGPATAFSFAPDGRIFVAQQDGNVRIVKNGALLAQPFATLAVVNVEERGLLGVAVDPNFASNSYIYVYYTAGSPTVHNRISRLRAVGDSAEPGSEVTLFELDDVGVCQIHMGGALQFAADGKLFVGVGDHCLPDTAQSLSRLSGKLLRLNSDGSIPTDNPFYGSATGRYRAIWARGLRNPFTLAISRSGRIFINDVGFESWEEINEGVAGANYGWPESEGPTTVAGLTAPLYAYPHINPWPTGCSVVGGAFYDSTTPQYPSAYRGKYFYADYCKGYIRTLDTASYVSEPFVEDIVAPVGLSLGPDGLLYRLERAGSIVRIRYSAAQPPTIGVAPTSRTVAAGQSTTFVVSASGSQPLSYQWQYNGANIQGATAASYTRTVLQSDHGALIRVLVSNAFGSVQSVNATLSVSANAAPIATIDSPSTGSTYAGGDTIAFTGRGQDAEDGSLAASALTWEVVFHHDQHTHPFIAARSGQASGTFVIPRIGHTETNVFYRIHLRVRDSTGLEAATFRDLKPRLTTLSLQTDPSGLAVTLDGSPVTTPISVLSVVGNTRSIGVLSPQTIDGASYSFGSWSDDGTATHNIDVPAANASYTATFRESCDGALIPVTALSSSEESAAYGASQAIDGNPSTRWSSAFSDPQWIQVDLGAPQRIARLQLNWETAHARDYQVQVSETPAGAWSTIFTRSAFAGGVDNISGLSATARYVRIYVTARATDWGNSLWELASSGRRAVHRCAATAT